MKLCPYCNQKISFFGTLFGGIDHTECNSEAIKHINFLRNYLKKEVMLGRFNKIAPNEFTEAQNFLSGTLEAKEAMAAGFDDAVEEMCDDISLDDEELQKIERFLIDFETRFPEAKPGEVSTKEYVRNMLNQYGSFRTLGQGRILYELQKGILPNIQAPAGLMLNKNETFIYSWNSVRCSILNVKTRYRGRSTGGTYRISKNFSIRHTEHRGKPVAYTEWKDVGSGILLVTNKHLIFLGDVRDVKERFSKISSLDPTSDGFIVNLSLKTRPAVRFTMSGSSRDVWFASNMILKAPLFEENT